MHPKHVTFDILKIDHEYVLFSESSVSHIYFELEIKLQKRQGLLPVKWQQPLCTKNRCSKFGDFTVFTVYLMDKNGYGTSV